MKINEYFNDMKIQIIKDGFAWLSFSCWLTWVFGLFWSGIFDQTVFAGLEIRAMWQIVEAGALIVLYAFFHFRTFLGRGPVLGAGSIAFVGTVVALFTENLLWQTVGILVTAVGSAYLLAFIGIHFAQRGARKLLINVALALLVASILDTLLVLVFPLLLQKMAIALAPAFLVFFAIASFSQQKSHSMAENASGVQSRVAMPSNNSTPLPLDKKKTWAIRYIALPLIVGFTYGLMQRLGGTHQEVSSIHNDMLTIASFAASAVVVIIAALVFRSTGLIRLVCFVAIPIVSVAFVLLPLFENAGEAAHSVCIVGFNSFYFMVWAFWSSERDVSLLSRRFALGLAMLTASQALGSYLGRSVLHFAQESGQVIAIVSLVVVYFLLMAGILFFNRVEEQRLQIATLLSPSEEKAEPSSINIDAIAQRYGFSPRETEVFELLAKGRNRVYISQKLVVSDNTTRTHMRNIYRKLEVHSQQELIDVLEKDLLES